MVDSSQTRLASITEATYGTTPSTPTFLIQRFTGESLNYNIQNVKSNEIRADRNVSDSIQVGSDVSGSVEFELSYGSFDEWLESLFYSVWSTNVLKNGVTAKSFSIEKTFEAGATDQFHRFTGCIADTLSLSISSQNIITGSFGFMGKSSTVAQAAIAGSSYTSVNANPVINAAANFASLAVTGWTGPEITELNINITNNLRQQPVVGSLDSRGIGVGEFEVTGDFTAYFESQDLYDLFIAGTAADLAFTIGGASSKNYAFLIGNLKFEAGEVVTPGNNQDIMVKMGFRGLYDGTDNTLQITRTA